MIQLRSTRGLRESSWFGESWEVTRASLAINGDLATRLVHTYPLQSGNFWIHYESRIVWTLNPDISLSRDVTRSSPVLYCEYSRWCRAQCYRFFTSWTQVSSLITCVQLDLASYDYCTTVNNSVQFNYAKRRLDILGLLQKPMTLASFYVGCTNWTP